MDVPQSGDPAAVVQANAGCRKQGTGPTGEASAAGELLTALGYGATLEGDVALAGGVGRVVHEGREEGERGGPEGVGRKTG